MNHWTQFWNSTATLSSFAEGDAAAGYQGELKAFWERVFARAPHSATILDIGTGNGALAYMATEYSQLNRKNFVVHASDAAKIDPVAMFAKKPEIAKSLQQIQFHSETATEKLPFDDASIDLVTSQFAFEYGEQEASLAEVMRVLKPGGAAVLMLHHKDSELIKESQLGHAILKNVLRETPLFIQADLLLRIAHQYLENATLEEWLKSQHCQATTKTTQWIMGELRARYSDPQSRVWIDDVLARVARLMHNIQKGETRDRLQGLGLEYDLLTKHMLRVEEQIQAAYDKTAADQLVVMAQGMGSKARTEPYSLMLDAEGNSQASLFAMKVVINKAG